MRNLNNKALGIMLIVAGLVWAMARVGIIEGPNFLLVLATILIAGYFLAGYRTPLLVAGTVLAAVGLFADTGEEGYLFFIFLGAAFAAVYLIEYTLHRNGTWALYPAGGLIVFGLFVMFVQNEDYAMWLGQLWPIALIALGILLLMPKR
ncbi:MAG: hypothetical protein ACOCVQ_02215 [Bacillota bacterium]